MIFTKKELESIIKVLVNYNVEVELQIRICSFLIMLEHYNLCLWKFRWDCGRQGEIEGVFKATKKQVENIIGQEIHFGEILGKHSNIYGDITEEDITLISSEPSFVFNSTTHGYNPFDYWTCSSCGSIINPNRGICTKCAEDDEEV